MWRMSESNIDGIEISASNDERRDRADAENSEDEPKHRRMRLLRKGTARLDEADTFAQEEGEEESGLQSADSDRGCQGCR